MEELKTLNWQPALEDLIDNEFVNEEHFQNESATHKMVNGIFCDPFQDIRPFITKQVTQKKQGQQCNKVNNQRKTRTKRKKNVNTQVKI